LVKVLVRRISTGLYWNSNLGWVQAEEAEAFANSGVAIMECVNRRMRDVYVILSFDDSKYDIVLHPFGETGHGPTSRELIEQSHELKEKSKGISQRVKVLLAGAHQTIAALKELRKQRTFKRKSGTTELPPSGGEK
jgi:hypothetical protein